MAVTKPWVGSSAKAETGMAWMGDARVALRLPRAGWMSEMVGRSKEIRFVNNTNRTQANIYELMGSPKEVTTYIFENNATISAATQGGWALQTGAFPAGSTLTIINRGFIRGGGGNSTNGAGQKGGDALILNFPTHLNNSQGYIYGGGGGGGSWAAGGIVATGGGGAGTPAGLARTGSNGTGSNGTATTGGSGSSFAQARAGKGGNLGQAGTASSGGSVTPNSGGAAGRAVVRNGHALSWLGGNDGTRVKGPIA